eukprot:gene256-biopygen22574
MRRGLCCCAGFSSHHPGHQTCTRSAHVGHTFRTPVPSPPYDVGTPGFLVYRRAADARRTLAGRVADARRAVSPSQCGRTVAVCMHCWVRGKYPDAVPSEFTCSLYLDFVPPFWIVKNEYSRKLKCAPGSCWRRRTPSTMSSGTVPKLSPSFRGCATCKLQA